MDNILAKVITDNIRDENCIFVFPTDIAAQKWADWVIKNTDTLSVPMEKFTAWDKFKGECIKSKIEDLKSVPSIMRKIFASWLIEKNARELFFKELISKEYAENASAFTDWIAKLLPSLGIWKKLYDNQLSNKQIDFDDEANESSLKNYFNEYKNSNFCDGEDKDLLIIYDEYSKFLEENKCFDPAWVEPDFHGEKKYFIVYPEILEDWQQYEYRLSEIENIDFVHVPENCGAYESYFFDNSRTELKDVALYLRSKYEEGINWADIAVSVPDMDNYGSYIDREFSLYDIPHSMRYSKFLSDFGAGNVFSQLQECVSTDFSYNSLKNLLLNDEIPWNQKSAIDDLLLFGKMNNCICTFNENNTGKKIRTVWNSAFENPKDDDGTFLNRDENIKTLYKSLVELIPAMVQSESFEELRDAYEKFKDKFFDMKNFAQMELSNNVLSRCISSLNELCDLEKEYSSYKIDNPYGFFVSHLSTVQYLPQGENYTVQILPYRTAAPAPFKIHVVVDAAQDSLSVSEMFKPLTFINENKRKLFMKLGQKDKNFIFRETDPSFEFIKLYSNLSTENTYFTASKHAFNGSYGFAHGKIENTVDKVPTPKKTVSFRKDDFTIEKNYLMEDDKSKVVVPEKIYSIQKTGYENWRKRNEALINADESEENSVLEEDNNTLFGLTEEEIEKRIKIRMSFVDENSEKAIRKDSCLFNKYKISQSNLSAFWKCPRRWFFKEVLQLKPLDNEAELIDNFILGTVNHKVFENYFGLLKENNLVLRTSEEDKTRLSENYRKYLIKAMNDAVNPENKDSAFKTFINTNSVSNMSQLLIISQYKITETDEEMLENNRQFKMLENSIANLSILYSGYSVYAMEKNLNALVYKENGEPENFYFNGKIDCILEGPNHSDYTIIDFKTSSLPNKLLVKEKTNGNLKDLINFQMPMYIYLLKNAVNPEDRLEVQNCLFYSIKNAEAKFYLGNDVIESVNEKTVEKNQNNKEPAEIELLTYAKEFYERLKNQDFSVDPINQSAKKCGSKNQYDNCIDYQAICRKYFTICGIQE